MPIFVETIRKGNEVVLAVEDAGPGILPEDAPQIFEPFYRAAQTRRRGIAGVGLGLAVVHRIAVAFGGSVGVRSEPGKGSRFEVRLVATAPPIESADDREAARLRARGLIGPADG
jgi:two-component system sensor histidine kinase BaeS